MKNLAWLLLTTALLLVLGTLPGAAAAPSGGAVILPVYIQGSYQPVQGPQFTDQLMAVLARAGLGKNVLRLSAESLRAAGFSLPQQPPPVGIAQGACQESGKRFCVWLSLQMSADMGAKGDYLAMGASSRFWAYDSQGQAVVLDAPLSSLHSMPLGPKPTPDAIQDATRKLVTENIEDLALQIVALTEQETASQRVQTWQAAAAAQQPPTPAAPSALYQAMAKACQDYGKAVGSGDLMATQDALKRAYTAWPQLSASEQEAIEKRFPGTYRWMNGGVWYGGGYYYPPVW